MKIALPVSLPVVVAATFLHLPAAALAQEARFEAEALQCRGCSWFKGNTHTHTTESDGDSSPEYVARWYKAHGYDFLILSDHNTITDPDLLDHLMDDGFLLVPGEEVTSTFESKPVHVNALNVHEFIEPVRENTLVGTIQANVDAVRDVEAIPHINHPNFGWAFGPRELEQVGNYKLLEIFNGHPSVHNAGGGGFPGMEEVWDRLLTEGKVIYGIAVDDAHHFQSEFSPTRSNPGRGWVAVKAPDLSASALMEALEAGRFYASTGVELEEVVVTEDRLEVRIDPRESFKYTTTFIGAGGRVLGEAYGERAVFDLKGPELYVRARVQDSGGSVAWVQPVFVSGR
jgi:predicted metal-dependent phosphoesterase TrpH